MKNWNIILPEHRCPFFDVDYQRCTNNEAKGDLCKINNCPIVTKGSQLKYYKKNDDMLM